MIKDPQIGEKVWFLKFPFTGTNSHKTLEANFPRAYKGEIEFVGNEGIVSIKGYGLFRVKDCLFRTKGELIKRI